MKIPMQSLIPIGFSNIPSIDEDIIKADLKKNLSSCGEVISILIKIPYAVCLFNRQNNDRKTICDALPLGPLGMFVGPNEIERINL